MTKTAILRGGPLDGHRTQVASLFIGFETGLFPHIGFTRDGKDIDYAPMPEEDDEPGEITYRQVVLVRK